MDPGSISWGYPDTSPRDFDEPRLDNDVPEVERGNEFNDGKDGNEAIEEKVDDEESVLEPEGGIVMVPLA